MCVWFSGECVSRCFNPTSGLSCHTFSRKLASALEQVDSLQHGLRCGVHMELAKVCADQDQLQMALEHVNKAQELDRECEWSEELMWLGERLRLRSELHLTPPSTLQQATQLLEQVKSVGGFGSKEEMRAVLAKVGSLLAPRQFTVAIGDKAEETSQTEGDTAREIEEGGGEKGEKEKEGKEQEGTEGEEEKEEKEEPETTGKDGEKEYQVLKQQIQAHKIEVGSTDDVDRCRLWADLAKFARKCQVWDVAFVSAKFCLTYDDNRWTVSPVKTGTQPSKTGSKSKLQKSSSVSVNRSRSDVSTRSSSLSVAGAVSLASGPAAEREAGRQRGRERLCRELLRTLAQTHFIHAECAVYQLKESGHHLGDGLPPLSPSTSDQQDAENKDKLVVWPGNLSLDAYSSFHRGGDLGVSLGEPWLVANAATYLSNYSQHLLEAGALSRLVPVFRPLLDSLTAATQLHTGSHDIGGELVCHVSTVLAGGLVQKWTPSPPDPTKTDPTSKENLGGRKSGRGTATGKKKGGGGGETQLQVSPDGAPELEEALGVCERGLALARDLPLGVRAPLLAVWVCCRQLLHQPIPSNTLGVEEKDGEDGSVAGQARAVVAVEMQSLLGNRIWEFPDSPTLNDTFDMVSSSKWSEEDSVLELELLTRTARLALLQKNYTLVGKCVSQALAGEQSRAGSEGASEKKKKKRGKKEAQCERELLSSICSLHGQTLAAQGAGKTVAARAAMEAFLQSAKYGRDAGSYQRTIEAARHYGNVCRELTETALDRETLRQPLTQLLAILTSFLPCRSSRHSSGQEDVCEEDLQLNVAFYNILFQIYIDKGEWAEGMKAVEDAMWATPRSIHQCLAEYKLIFKSRMGKDVAADMIRFQDAPEEERARLWYKVACNSSHPRLQLTAFQNSINTLTSPEYVVVKIDYLLALSEWLYCHQFPVEDALSHLRWALALLMDTVREEGKREVEEEEGGEDGRREAKFECGVLAREKAVYILVMMAKLQGKGSGGHRESCLAALAHCCLMWKAILDSYGGSVSDKASVTLPSSIQEWVDFTLTDELRDFVKSAEDDCSIIRTPGLTSHCLGALSDELCGSGLQGLALPAETLRLLLVESLVQSTANSQLIQLRLATMCDVIGARNAAEEHRKLTGPVFLNPDEMARSRAEIAHHQQKQEMAKTEGSKDKSPESLARKESWSLSHSPRDPMGKPILHQVWVETAALLVKQGLWEVARELLQEAKLSSQVLGDRETDG
ncbi:Cilia- and flagella-associated protein 46 [Geodia barretti]|uniref:Cilia- and flagella-associated protein 46 n=1 Tax=Geodia barretti TaxID=519541 RepID=A0AA35QVT3_GEOBA|nr:Cilia- and flagella-associated protein 46 [Geodia barretti]